jgi:hypothetical protein
MPDRHRSILLASVDETYLATAPPMPLPLPHPLGKYPPRKAAEMIFSSHKPELKSHPDLMEP